MQADTTPVARDIVLVGGGHSHVGVLRHFAMHPPAGVRITLICRDTHTPYSGMLPGYIAGHYSFDEVHIDLRRLCDFAGARFIRDEVTGLDRATQRVLCRSRPSLAYDRVSINIGSTPHMGSIPGARDHAVPVKPIHRFDEHWRDLLTRLAQHQGPFHLAVVGGGAGGVELLLAMQHRLQSDSRHRDLRFALFQAGDDILPGHNPRVRRYFRQLLARRGIDLHTGERITRVKPNYLYAGDRSFPADAVLWVTQAGGADWLRDTDLPLDAAGFIRVNEYLHSPADEHVFAAGDIATMTHAPRAKAGVFAVRQAGPLARNLMRSLAGRPLKSWWPQKQFLALISTGDRFAVASRGPFSLRGHWMWRWKDHIDRRFMALYQDLPAMPPAPAPQLPDLALPAAQAAQMRAAGGMRCGGCGAKVGGDILTRALARMQPVQNDDVLAGLDSPDDAAIMKPPAGRKLVQTVDFFPAFIDDPWLFGAIAANHCLGDLYAMGAEPWTAQAIA
jgi:selenide,water dikinase